MKERLLAQGAIPSGNTPAEFAKLDRCRDEEVGAGGEGVGREGRLVQHPLNSFTYLDQGTAQEGW